MRRLLEVVSAVGQVEALVAEREVGDLLVAQRHRQPGPVVERGIDDLVGGERAAASSVMATWQISPRQPSTSETHEAVRARRRARRARAAPRGSAWSCVAHERRPSARSPASARRRARRRRPTRQVEIGMWANWKMPGGMDRAHVASQPAGARRGADQPELARDVSADTRPVSSKRACTDGGVPEQARRRPSTSRYGRVEALAAARSIARRLDVEADAAGPHQAAAEAAAAQERGQVEEVAAQAAAVRRPSAGSRRRRPARPRSPVWLASRSSSSAIAAQRLRARRRRGPPPAPRAPGSRPCAWPIVVSPASVSM